MKSARTLATLIPALFLISCSSVGGELRQNLRAYGMNKDEAKCVSSELVDSLDKSEIESINRILRTGRNDGTARPSQLVDAVQALDNARLARTVAIANAGCLLLN